MRRRLPMRLSECYGEAEQRACLRIEAAIERLIKSACKRRDELEIKLQPWGAKSPEYLIAAHEVMVLSGWRAWIHRNCDYRRMQIEAEVNPANADRKGGR